MLDSFIKQKDIRKLFDKNMFRTIEFWRVRKLYNGKILETYKKGKILDNFITERY